MYLQHFGLNQEPFSIAPDPHYLFMSHRHREALAHLLYGVGGTGGAGDPALGGGVGGSSSGGFVLLTGDIGTGKTTVCRCFLAQVPANCQVAYIFNPKLTVPELLQTIGEEFHLWPHAPAPGEAPLGSPVSQGLSPKVAIDALNAFLLRSHAAGQQCVLVIDEAQNLQAEVLEQLRLLTNLETNERKLLQIILIGQPELRDLLARPELEQLAQRVVARFHLDALTEEETGQYMAHRLRVAGLTGPLPFAPPALRRIHRLTGGVPRRINLLCGRALLGAWTLGQHTVGPEVVKKAAAEVFGPGPARQGLALPWRIPRQKPSQKLIAALAMTVTVATVAAVAVVSSGLWLGQRPTSAPEQATPATPPGASAGPNAPVLNPAAQPLEIVNLGTLMPQLPTQPEAAWQELARHWTQATATADTPGTPNTDPAATCEAVARQGWVCYRTTRMSTPLLRQLDRPGILTLQTEQGPPRYAVLVGLNGPSATLAWGGQTHHVHLVALANAWRGEFATLWQPPPGFGDRLLDDASGPAVEQLTTRLAQLDGQHTANATPTLDAALKARIRAFQQANDLTPDGRPGPMTFMQLERATGHPAPRLNSAPPTDHVLHP